MKRIIATAGGFVSLGFLAASAVANYMFGASLGRTSWEAQLYGTVGVLAVAMNALAPFYISWSLTAARRTTAASVLFLWLLCLAYRLARRVERERSVGIGAGFRGVLHNHANASDGLAVAAERPGIHALRLAQSIDQGNLAAGQVERLDRVAADEGLDLALGRLRAESGIGIARLDGQLDLDHGASLGIDQSARIVSASAFGGGCHRWRTASRSVAAGAAGAAGAAAQVPSGSARRA